ncbi:uncharacterized membrane protein YdcZ (DUF606 family) [Saccharothrix tamanrassetensis]|uniref:Uncharacterized membrane protein YdcZ (DUF606 family) n=1 Tax=Saccharothrix tamanrassetensis TaxID=1051531 RepID=A0A841CJM9_9PSEU|nr:hypothetical protein [Saccharothrix tamanrassetensis]MBB5955846.1 uncharacterized membrane protein YdcZ (DUF606 family) [Saccharothrix tamanrassetensis]
MGERTGLAVVAALMLGCAAFGPFPHPVPLLFVIAAAGAANAAFPLMRTFGSALLGGVAAAGVGVAAVPFVTCSSERFTEVFTCTADAPTWHLTGSVLVAGLSGAALVLARVLGTASLERRLAAIERAVEERK